MKGKAIDVKFGSMAFTFFTTRIHCCRIAAGNHLAQAGFYLCDRHGLAIGPCDQQWAGAPGFRDFPGLADDEGESHLQSPNPAVL